MLDNKTYLEDGNDYDSLSIKDLLEARDAYHVFLTRKKNVIGTAIGKYRIRKPDIDRKSVKTLENTEVRKDSWPCVLVFVREWVDDDEFGKNPSISKDDYLPKHLYLTDGRRIPVCVIAAAWHQKGSTPITTTKLPGSVIGGGYPVMTKVQGEDRWATLSCLVTDGRTTYALTNSHVAGRPGEKLFTMRNGNEEEIGQSSARLLQKMAFSSVYEDFPGRHSISNLDIGLIELDDLQGVTSQIYGIGAVRGVADVNHDTLSLKLIGCPVMGYGFSSGHMKGEIIALFYRYASAGGYDYVSDYFIGPRQGKSGVTGPHFAPRNGDSGTLLVIDDAESGDDRKAIGVLWGGQRDESGTMEQPYGLVTNLATICRLLEVELVCDWNRGYDRWFGAYAHVVLPSLCAGVVKDDTLRSLMENNTDRFSMSIEDTSVKDTKGLSKADFVPLSDVPDLVWKKRGGKYARGREGSNHFADMDQPDPNNGNRTLLDLCDNERNIDPSIWLEFYKGIGAREKGALPFRIAQIYDAMAGYAKQGSVAEFVCAAGILTHYVFDSCMPLHISYMHHGDPDGPMKTVTSGGKEKEVSIAYDVHAEFDNQMVEYYSETIRKELPALVKLASSGNMPSVNRNIKSAFDAAVATVKLMQNTVRQYVNPIEVVREYEGLTDMRKRERCDILWEKYGTGYMKAMAEAVVLTARLWDAAWKNGNGKENIDDTQAIPEKELRDLYETKEGFLDSVNLENIAKTMQWPSA